jgi:chromosome segregation ATPase
VDLSTTVAGAALLTANSSLRLAAQEAEAARDDAEATVWRNAAKHNEQLALTEANFTETQAQLADAVARLAVFASRQNELDHENKELQFSMQRATDDMRTELRAEVAALESERLAARKEITTLQEETNALTSKQNAIEQEAAETEDTIVSFADELQTALRTIARLEDDKRVLKTKLRNQRKEPRSFN